MGRLEVSESDLGLHDCLPWNENVGCCARNGRGGHGEADNNNGTFPIQSERLFSAIKGQGGTVRFVLLPLEAHGYAGRESVLHMFWEMNNWLNTYVKNPPAAKNQY